MDMTKLNFRGLQDDALVCFEEKLQELRQLNLYQL